MKRRLNTETRNRAFSLSANEVGGEGEYLTSLDNFSILVAVTDSVSLAVRRMATQNITWLNTRRIILPLLGERAGGEGGRHL